MLPLPPSEQMMGPWPPHEFINDVMRERGWTADDLGHAMGVTTSAAAAVMTGEQSVSAPVARLLGLAFGTSTELWLNLQAAWLKGTP